MAVKVEYIDNRRHIVREEVAEIELSGSFSDVVLHLQDLEERHHFDYENLFVQSKSEHHCYECGGTSIYVLYGDRKENEDEKKLRLRKQEKAREKKKAALEKKREQIRKEAEKLGLTVSE